MSLLAADRDLRGSRGPADARVARAWSALQTVLDPEVPALSVCDLGIVRDVIAHADGIEVVLTPTYSGCPATEVIERSVIEAVNAAGLGPAHVRRLRRIAVEQQTDIRLDRRAHIHAAAGILPPRSVLPLQAAEIRENLRQARIILLAQDPLHQRVLAVENGVALQFRAPVAVGLLE